MDIKNKRKVVLAYLKKYLNLADPTGTNYKRYEKYLGDMSDIEFSKWAKALKEKKIKLFLVAPNMKLNLELSNLFDAAEALGIKVFHRLRMYDQNSDRYYLTNEEYPVLKLHVRRQQQFLKEKLSVPDSDKTIDGLTGQVTGTDRASSLSNPEIQILYTRGLNKTLLELIKVRGGDIASYGEFKRQLEENGNGEIETLTANSRARSGVISRTILEAMHVENNI